MADFETVAKVGDIPAGQGRAFPYQGKMVAVFNQEDGYYAIDDFCPHMGASLAGGFVEDKVVICPWHAWRFCIEDGTWCDNPVIKIDNYEVMVTGDDIQVRLVEPPPAETDAEPQNNESADSEPPSAGEAQSS